MIFENIEIMKRTIKYISLGLMAVTMVSSCSDEFLQEKKNYDHGNYQFSAGESL